MEYPSTRKSVARKDSKRGLEKEHTPLVGSAGNNPTRWLRNLQNNFGEELLVLLFLTQHVLKGFTFTFVGQADNYLYRAYKVPGPQAQIYGTVTFLPWAFKPVIGLLSDTLPIWGYNKAPYMILTSLLGAMACLTIGFGAAPQAASKLSISGLVVSIVLVNLQVSTCDLLSEAKYAERVQELPAHGPDIVTFVWFGLQVGGLIAVACSGLVLVTYGPSALYCFAAVPSLMVLLPVFKGYLQERQLTSEEIAEAWTRFQGQKEMGVLAFIILFGTGLLAVCGMLYEDVYLNGAVAGLVVVITLIGFSLVLSPVIAKFNAFTLLQNAFSLSIRGAAFYFYTDTTAQYPEGPHFTPFFYNTVMGVCAAVCSLLGILVYKRYLCKWRYRSLLLATNTIFSLLCLMDVMMFSRINLHLGIPDYSLMFGSTVFETIVLQWSWMPSVVILAYLCPRGMEATMYALLAGCANLGASVSGNLGALLLAVLGCTPSGAAHESAAFDRLWVAAAFTSALSMFSILPLLGLVPDARQDERLISESQVDATSGSLWRQWQGLDQMREQLPSSSADVQGS
mmetsp:Transcript_44928/g.106669  ORF Transcript_44928/g.106669 Transcript_44928/m.106669 type:complete len:566 (+) Transcript_44928:35-1732(+)